MIIAIEGIIGAGKTRLIERLNIKNGLTYPEFQYHPFYEPVDENKYLGRFYKDPKKWAFPMQMELMFRRFKIQLQSLQYSLEKNEHCLLDRSLLGDWVFASVNNQKDNISDLEMQTYQQYYNNFISQLYNLDLIIYLEVDPLVAKQRLESRDRWQEKNIPLNYYEALDHTYRLLLTNYKQTVYVDWNKPNQDIQIIENIIAKNAYK